MTDLIKVSELRTSFGKGLAEVKALRGISLRIKKGETHAIVGESGSGKSVTALSIMQLLPYPLAHHSNGSIQFQGKELMGLKAEEMRKIRGNSIAMIFQEPLSSLNPLHTIEKQISEVLYLHKALSPKKARVRVNELLELVGLEEAKSRLSALPHEFSGGQQQRVMIAMALANNPDLLIADEPTTALDVTIQAQVLGLLKDLQKKLNMTLLLITHDLGVVRYMADKVSVMNNGEIVEQGELSQVFGKPKHEYTQHLLAAEFKGLSSLPPDKSKTIMTGNNVKVWFPIKKGVVRRTVGYVKAVNGITLKVRQGHTLGIVGESGSGKSTLGKAILRLQKSSGDITFEGESIQELRGKALRPLRQRMQIVFQDPYSSLSPRLSISQIIEEGLLVNNIATNATDRHQLIVEAIKEVGLETDMLNRYPHEFSGGQRQRIAIARALIVKPKFVVLDEPTSALDMSVQAQIIDLLRKLQKNYNLAYLFISHDLKVIRAMAHEILVMQNGNIVEQGPTEEILNNPRAPYTKTLMAAAFDIKAEKASAVAS
jgi:microcin C transport system ATP-binding protein